MQNISRALRNNEHKLVPIGKLPEEGFMNMYGVINPSGRITWLDGTKENQEPLKAASAHHFTTRTGFVLRTTFRPREHFPAEHIKVSANCTHVSFSNGEKMVVENINTARRVEYTSSRLFTNHSCPQFHFAYSFCRPHISFDVLGEGKFLTQSNKTLIGRTDAKYVLVDNDRIQGGVYTTDRDTAKAADQLCSLQRIATLVNQFSYGFVYNNILVITPLAREVNNRTYYFYQITDNSIRWLWTSVFRLVSVVDGTIRAFRSTGEYFEIYLT